MISQKDHSKSFRVETMDKHDFNQTIIRRPAVKSKEDSENAEIFNASSIKIYIPCLTEDVDTFSLSVFNIGEYNSKYTEQREQKKALTTSKLDHVGE